MAEYLRGNPGPTGQLGPLLIDVAYQSALERLIEHAVHAQMELSDRHSVPLSFDDKGVRALDRIVAELTGVGRGLNSDALDYYAGTIGAVLACSMLKIGNSITAFRHKDERCGNFSIYVPRTRVEYFPFHQSRRMLTTPKSRGLDAYYQDFLRVA